MKKEFLSVLLALAVAFTACDKKDTPNPEPDQEQPGGDEPGDDPEEEANLGFTYANGELFAYGKGKKETIDVAIRLNNKELAGKTLKGFKAYITTADGISGFSLWASKELTITNKVNVPDLFSFDVTPTSAVVGENELQCLNLELETPYQLTGEPIYIGYSMTVDATDTDEQKSPIVLSEGVNEDGLYLHMSKSVLKWMSYSSTVNGVAFIEAEIEGEFPDNALGIAGNDAVFGARDESFSALVYVTNNGVNPIESVRYTYSYNDTKATEYEGFVELEEPVEPSMALSTPISLPFESIPSLGEYEITLTITEVNGEPNEASNPTFTMPVNIFPFIPKHRPLMEEFTGLWCGWCPRGFLAMEEIGDVYGDAVVVACYHSGDAMEVTSQTPINISGYPSASVNRNKQVDPYYGSTNGTNFGIFQDLNKAIDGLCEAEIEVSATLSGNTVNAEASVTFIDNFNNANYQIGYLLISNGLTSPDWVQHNYFSGDPAYFGTPLEVLTTWPADVKDLIFNDVVIDANAMFGVPASLPSNIVTENTYTNNYSFDIEDNYLVQNPDNLVVAAFVINKSTNKVVNSNKYLFSKN